MDYFNANNNKNMKMIYSTPSQYSDLLRNSDIRWSTHEGDFMPYATKAIGKLDTANDFIYWTGFYSSRPNAKRLIRYGQANLHASNKLYTERVIDQEVTDEEVALIMQAKHAVFDTQGVY